MQIGIIAAQNPSSSPAPFPSTRATGGRNPPRTLCYDGRGGSGEDSVSGSGGIFLRGIEQFNRGEFFAAHETWEAIWLGASGRDKIFLQGTIQLAAAFHQRKRGNARGARSLLRRAIEKLKEFPAVYRGVRVDRLQEQAEHWAKALADDAPDCRPRIELARLPGRPRA